MVHALRYILDLRRSVQFVDLRSDQGPYSLKTLFQAKWYLIWRFNAVLINVSGKGKMETIELIILNVNSEMSKRMISITKNWLKSQKMSPRPSLRMTVLQNSKSVHDQYFLSTYWLLYLSFKYNQDYNIILGGNNKFIKINNCKYQSQSHSNQILFFIYLTKFAYYKI